jgi:hypothetical protein
MRTPRHPDRKGDELTPVASASTRSVRAGVRPAPARAAPPPGPDRNDDTERLSRSPGGHADHFG